MSGQEHSPELTEICDPGYSRLAVMSYPNMSKIQNNVRSYCMSSQRKISGKDLRKHSTCKLNIDELKKKNNNNIDEFNYNEILAHIVKYQC